MEKDLLPARLSDAIGKSERGTLAVLPFLTPRDVLRAKKELTFLGRSEQAWFYGGYAGAERACCFLLPEYLAACLPSPLPSCPDEDVLALIGEDVAGCVAAVRITGSGFRELTHRDFLGAVLGLGLERDALGDLCVQDPHTAVLFCPRALVSFLVENLVKVGSDVVRTAAYEPDAAFTDGRRCRPIRDTVASSRLDCVVAALTNLSRDAAQSAIRSGLVEVDFEPVDRVDLPLSAPSTLSVRGYGRYVLRSFDGETRKGRLRMFAEQMI